MYLGRLVEIAPVSVFNYEPAHPYTKALMAANPVIHSKKQEKRLVLGGDVPSPLTPPSGCHFHPRCPEANETCKTVPPKAVRLSEDHIVECHLFE